MGMESESTASKPQCFSYYVTLPGMHICVLADLQNPARDSVTLPEPNGKSGVRPCLHVSPHGRLSDAAPRFLIWQLSVATFRLIFGTKSKRR